MSYQNYYVAGLASKFVKVSLAGAGGDEAAVGGRVRLRRAERIDRAGVVEEVEVLEGGVPEELLVRGCVRRGRRLNERHVAEP